MAYHSIPSKHNKQSEFVQFRAMNGILEPDLFIYKQTGQALTTTKRWSSTHPEQFTTHIDHSYHYCCQLEVHGWLAGYINSIAALGVGPGLYTLK